MLTMPMILRLIGIKESVQCNHLDAVKQNSCNEIFAKAITSSKQSTENYKAKLEELLESDALSRSFIGVPGKSD